MAITRMESAPTRPEKPPNAVAKRQENARGAAVEDTRRVARETEMRRPGKGEVDTRA